MFSIGKQIYHYGINHNNHIQIALYQPKTNTTKIIHISTFFSKSFNVSEYDNYVVFDDMNKNIAVFDGKIMYLDTTNDIFYADYLHSNISFSKDINMVCLF